MRDPTPASRILVTGASGFVGRHLAAHLKSLGANVIAWGVSTPPVDIRDERAVQSAMARDRPDAIVHLAAIALSAAARRDPREAWTVNVMGTSHLAQATLTHAPQARFVYVGSSECYGTSFNATGAPVAEHAALAPITTYGATKAAADLMIGQMARDGLRSVRLRPFNHSGPDQSDAYVVSDFARQIAAIEAQGNSGVIQVGNLDARRDMLDVRDVITAYARAASSERPIAPGTPINISTGRAVAIRDILDGLIALSSADIRVEVDASRVRPNEILCASGDLACARALLDWQPDIPLATTLIDVLNGWRAKLAA